ncbi:hypothetical protein [Methylocystis sp.]|uniref:hypothetical protein n=1 Tax=Methylocystis sp. TaxID=1911079 RepID=UPI0025DFA4F3|nr:hypothetical protein [Methylocystis sp.]
MTGEPSPLADDAANFGRTAPISLQAKLGSTSNPPTPVKKRVMALIAPQINAASERDVEAEIVCLHNCFQAACETKRVIMRRVIGKGCAVAAYLESNESAWRAFCDDEIWSARKSKPNPAKPDKALRYVLLRIAGLNAPKVASKWFKAVQPLVARGVDPTEMPAAIEDGGGIERLARAQAKRKKSIITQGGLTKNPARAAAKMARSGEVERGLVGKKPAFVNICASMEENGASILGLPMDSYASLTVQLRGREGPELEIAILDARQIDYPE